MKLHIIWRTPWFRAHARRAGGEALALGALASLLIALSSYHDFESFPITTVGPSFIVALAVVGVPWYALRARMEDRWRWRRAIEDAAVGAVLGIPVAAALLYVAQTILARDL